MYFDFPLKILIEKTETHEIFLLFAFYICSINFINYQIIVLTIKLTTARIFFYFTRTDGEAKKIKYFNACEKIIFILVFCERIFCCYVEHAWCSKKELNGFGFDFNQRASKLFLWSHFRDERMNKVLII